MLLVKVARTGAGILKEGFLLFTSIGAYTEQIQKKCLPRISVMI